MSEPGAAARPRPRSKPRPVVAPEGGDVSEPSPKATTSRRSGGERVIASYPLRNIGTIIGKELQSYFASPIAYFVMAAFLVMNGYLFWAILVGSRQADMSPVFSDMAIILLLLSPSITMRLLSEEQRQGTIELLLTSPIRDSELVLGKWLASMVFFLAMLVLTGTYPLFLVKYGTPDLGTIGSGYLGIFLLEGVFLAIGLFISSLTQNQIVALALSFGVLLILWLFQPAGQNFGQGGGSTFLQYLGLSGHFDSFTSGSIQVKDLVYYLSLIVLPLFLTVRAIESRRWR